MVIATVTLPDQEGGTELFLFDYVAPPDVRVPILPVPGAKAGQSVGLADSVARIPLTLLQVVVRSTQRWALMVPMMWSVVCGSRSWWGARLYGFNAYDSVRTTNLTTVSGRCGRRGSLATAPLGAPRAAPKQRLTHLIASSGL